jgi:hypothetical protein
MYGQLPEAQRRKPTLPAVPDRLAQGGLDRSILKGATHLRILGTRSPKALHR